MKRPRRISQPVALALFLFLLASFSHAQTNFHLPFPVSEMQDRALDQKPRNTLSAGDNLLRVTSSGNHTLTVNSLGASSVPITGNPSAYGGTTNYTRSGIPSGASITLTAPATSGPAPFSSWTGCSNATERTCYVTMDGNRTATANYTLSGNHTLTVNSVGASSVPITGSPSAYGGTTNYTRSGIPSGASITLTAPATSGTALFSSWNGCTSSNQTTMSCFMTMNGNHTVSAHYLEQYTVTYDGNGHDIGAPPVDTGRYVAGTWVFILGNSGNMARAGHVFTGWNDQPDRMGTPYDPGRTFRIEEDMTLYAQWDKTDLRTLYLPHIDGTNGWQTQVALVNAGHEPAEATLLVRIMDGTPAEVPDECKVGIQLPPGSRVEYISGVDDCLPGIKGYAEVETYSEDVVGFTRFAMQDTYRMSLPLQEVYGEEEVFIPYVMSNVDQETFLGLINPHDVLKTVQIAFLDQNGIVSDSFDVPLGAGQHKIISVREFYENVPQPAIKTARISDLQ